MEEQRNLPEGGKEVLERMREVMEEIEVFNLELGGWKMDAVQQ